MSERVRFVIEVHYHGVVKCLQEGSVSLYDALFVALRDSKHQFVHLFMERVDMKTFLDNECLRSLYRLMVLKIHRVQNCFCQNFVK